MMAMEAPWTWMLELWIFLMDSITSFQGNKPAFITNP
jgi:hypothetical protein